MSDREQESLIDVTADMTEEDDEDPEGALFIRSLIHGEDSRERRLLRRRGEMQDSGLDPDDTTLEEPLPSPGVTYADVVSLRPPHSSIWAPSPSPGPPTRTEHISSPPPPLVSDDIPPPLAIPDRSLYRYPYPWENESTWTEDRSTGDSWVESRGRERDLEEEDETIGPIASRRRTTYDRPLASTRTSTAAAAGQRRTTDDRGTSTSTGSQIEYERQESRGQRLPQERTVEGLRARVRLLTEVNQRARREQKEGSRRPVELLYCGEQRDLESLPREFVWIHDVDVKGKGKEIEGVPRTSDGSIRLGGCGSLVCARGWTRDEKSRELDARHLEAYRRRSIATTTTTTNAHDHPLRPFVRGEGGGGGGGGEPGPSTTTASGSFHHPSRHRQPQPPVTVRETTPIDSVWDRVQDLLDRRQSELARTNESASAGGTRSSSEVLRGLQERLNSTERLLGEIERLHRQIAPAVVDGDHENGNGNGIGSGSGRGTDNRMGRKVERVDRDWNWSTEAPPLKGRVGFHSDGGGDGTGLAGDEDRGVQVRTCGCVVQEVGCLTCGNVLGFYILRPCWHCQSLPLVKAGHAWRFYTSAVSSRPRPRSAPSRSAISEDRWRNQTEREGRHADEPMGDGRSTPPDPDPDLELMLWSDIPIPNTDYTLGLVGDPVDWVGLFVPSSSSPSSKLGSTGRTPSDPNTSRSTRALDMPRPPPARTRVSAYFGDAYRRLVETRRSLALNAGHEENEGGNGSGSGEDSVLRPFTSLTRTHAIRVPHTRSGTGGSGGGGGSSSTSRMMRHIRISDPEHVWPITTSGTGAATSGYMPPRGHLGGPTRYSSNDGPSRRFEESDMTLDDYHAGGHGMVLNADGIGVFEALEGFDFGSLTTTQPSFPSSGPTATITPRTDRDPVPALSTAEAEAYEQAEYDHGRDRERSWHQSLPTQSSRGLPRRLLERLLKEEEDAEMLASAGRAGADEDLGSEGDLLVQGGEGGGRGVVRVASWFAHGEVVGR